MMDIMIISEFCGDFSKADNDRFLYLANLLMKESNDKCVEIVTSSFHHASKKHRSVTTEQWPFKVTFIEEPGYPRNVCLQRFKSHHAWGKNVLKYVRNRKQKPDVIYCAVPSLTGPNLIAKYCEGKGIRFIIDIQDLWPEAFQMVFNLPVVSKVVFSPFRILADGIYKRADVICAVSDTYCQRAAKVNKKTDTQVSVYLGTELAKFDRCAEKNPVIKPAGDIWLGYAGTLGTSYDLPIVFEALRILDNSRLKLIIMGDGPRKEEFESMAKGLNVDFFGRLPYDKMCGVLKACDIVVNPIIESSEATIINKHADYAASGKPVLNTQKSCEYRRLVNAYEMGINCDDAEELAKAIAYMLNNEGCRQTFGDNARRCAEERFDRGNSYSKLVQVLEGQVRNEVI